MKRKRISLIHYTGQLPKRYFNYNGKEIDTPISKSACRQGAEDSPLYWSGHVVTIHTSIGQALPITNRDKTFPMPGELLTSGVRST